MYIITIVIYTCVFRWHWKNY